jgi:hypothetical protein
MNNYDFLVYIKVEGMTEEEAQQHLLTFLKMAKLDFGLTYGIKDTDLVEFVVEKGSDV